MFDNKFFYHTFLSIIIIIISWLLGKISEFIISMISRKLLSKTKTTLDDKIIEVIKQHITLLSVIVGFHIAIAELRKGFTPDQTIYIQIITYIGYILIIVLVLYIARIVSKIIEAVFKWYMDEVSIKTQSNITATIAPLTNKIISIVIFLTGVMIILDYFGVSIGSLLVSLGVGSLAIALAAQDTLANMIAGFVIMLDRPYRVGDRIQIPSGEIGDVAEIGLRSTRVLNFDNNYVVIPNAEMIKSRIVNYSYPKEEIRAFVDVGVEYGTDIDKAKQVLLNLAFEHPDVMKDPVPEVFFLEFAQSAIILRLNMRTDDFKKKWAIETSMREQIYKSFTKEKINIPLPQKVVHLVNKDEIKAS